MSLRGIPMGSKRRVWTNFGFGLVLGPFLILLSEIIFIVFSTFVGILYISKISRLNIEFMIFFNLLIGSDSIQEIQELLDPYLANPWVLLTLLIFISLIVPLVEEFLKPAGTWLAMNWKTKLRDGFVMGALSCAGYALFETLSASGSMNKGWNFDLLGQAGTDLLHIFTTSLIGWAKVSD